MRPSDHPYAAALAQFGRIGPMHLKKLLPARGTFQAIWQASRGDLIAGGCEANLADAFVAARHGIIPEKIWEKCESSGITLLAQDDPHYPKLLLETYDAPAFLFARGLIAAEDPFPFAVVGTRKASAYGRQITYEIIPELVQQGVTVVSGMALGIDATAHTATLDSHGRTIAVLGSGIDDAAIYPSHNRQLAKRIISEGGLILSEYAPHALPLKHHFPYRNRIIAGMTMGVLVVEADIESGSLITARHSLDENREVFAIPGDITRSGSAGPNNLIKMGAKVVTSAQDILDALHLQTGKIFLKTREFIPNSREESALLPLITREPKHIDELVRASGLQAASVSATLTLMEMKGSVRNLGSMMYVRSR